MISVTFVAHDRPNYFACGPNTWLRKLLPALRERCIDARALVFTPCEGTPTIQALRDASVPCEFSTEVDTRKRIRWILKMIARDRPDVFVPNLNVAAYYCIPWVRQAGIPSVGVLHSDDDFYRGILDGFVSGPSDYRVNAVVAVSQYLEREASVRNAEGVRICRIPYGVRVPRGKARYDADPFRIAYVGRLKQEQKRIRDVSVAFCHLVEASPNVRCSIIGEGPEAQAVQQIIEHAGCGDRVALTGAVDNDRIGEILCEHQVIVLLSDYEGIPIALMEAMACGVVPICLNTRSGLSELIQQGVTGVLVSDRGDAFTSSVIALMKAPERWMSLSNAARELIVQDYGLEKCAERWAGLLHELASGQRQSVVRIPLRIKLPTAPAGMSHEDIRVPSAARKRYWKMRSAIRLRSARARG